MSEAEDHNDDVQAAEYAMHLLPSAERHAFEGRLAAEPQLRALVAQWNERLAPMSDDIPDVAPPPHVKTAMQKRLFAQNQSERTSFWNRLVVWRGLAFASMAAVLALLAVGLLQPPATGPVMVAEVAAADDSVRVWARYDSRQGVLEVSRVAGGPAAGRSLELWLVAGMDAPVSLGVMPTDARGRMVIAPELRAKMNNAVLAISDEPLGGSPTGKRTGALLAVGQINSV